VAVLSAHGVAPAVVEQARRRSLSLIDATCPLVTKVHSEVRRFVDQGYHIILIGHKGHDEVVGTTGEAPDNITLVETEEHAESVEVPPHEKLMVLTQTTLGVDDTAGILGALRRRFPKLELPPTEDICYATQNRQDAVKAMAREGMGLLLVVGSENSSNAVRLVEVGRARGVPAFLIDRAGEIRSEWLDGVELVGVTAGASTPEWTVQSVLSRLRELGADKVDVCTTVEEDTTFQLPPALRQALVERGGSPELAVKKPPVSTRRHFEECP
jgi:4-hydroxy-3-methylbut-2-enyl diphosphate reductase